MHIANYDEVTWAAVSMALSLNRYVFMRMAQSFRFWSVCMQGLQINIRGRCAEAVGIAFGMNT